MANVSHVSCLQIWDSDYGGYGIDSLRGPLTYAWCGHVTADALQTLKVMRSKVMSHKRDLLWAK